MTPTPAPAPAPEQRKDAHPSTAELHRQAAAALDLADTADFDDARRGFIGSVDDATIVDADGREVWSLKPYAFLKDEAAPLTVNPSLWRLARINCEHGLFHVVDRIYQVRGFDLANITFVEGDTGVIVIDPLTFEECARAALQLYEKHRGKRPIVAVLYSHSHRDHYGGVKGVISQADVDAGRVPVIAPEGFLEEAISEALLAGVPMRRRGEYQFGRYLEAGPKAHVDSGLGKGVGVGTSGLIAPTHSVRKTGERMVIDGVEIVFQMTPGTEAPAEMNFYFPAMRALNMAENACHTMHNLCPIRGAKVRDALAWSRYLDESVELYATQAEVCLAQHHWPTWGNENVLRFLGEQRDLYRYLHDQTLRFMSHGLTAREISERLMLPDALAGRWHVRGYYGALVHNVNAIYSFYMGPYDGNPANLNPLEPSAAAAKYIEYMGGIDAAVERAEHDYERGEFRWVAQIMNQAVFAQPGHPRARQLCADAFEQLGYQAESATWRNSYLLAARELRHGVRKPGPGDGGTAATLAGLPMPALLDILAIRLMSEKLASLRARIDWVMDDEHTVHRLTLDHGALRHRAGTHGPAADAVLRTTRAALRQVLAAPGGLARAIDDGHVRVAGDAALARRLFSSFDEFNLLFNIVEP